MASRTAPTPTPARALAWEILRRVDETGSFADVLLGRRFSVSTLTPRDRALVARLVYGTLAWRGFLDRAINAFSARPVAALEAPIRTLLELALFQLFKLERVPAHAAVHETVELAKTHGRGRAAGFVNAVLRRAAQEGEEAVGLPDPARFPGLYLAARYSHPVWMVERWLAQFGPAETKVLLQANNEPAPTAVRVNLRRTTRPREMEDLGYEGSRVAATRWSPVGIEVERPPATALPGVAEGRVSPQSEASQLVSFLLDPQPGERILDACAGSGAKTTHIAELVDDRAEIVATDLRHRPLCRLLSEARRLGLARIGAVVADARRPPLGARVLFDRILVDAPCTGLGTLRQHPEIRWRRNPANVAACARVQAALVAAALNHLRPGGVLVYATCTMLAEENENVVGAAARSAGIERQDAREVLPPALHALVDRDGALCTSPHRHGLDGFYAVRLKRC